VATPQTLVLLKIMEPGRAVATPSSAKNRECEYIADVSKEWKVLYRKAKTKDWKEWIERTTGSVRRENSLILLLNSPWRGIKETYIHR
jgi:hypothetical protein